MVRTLLDAVQRGQPDALAVVVAGSSSLRLSRGQLLQAVLDARNSLVASGIKPGDVVSIAMTNTADFIVAFLAVTSARAVAAPLNSAYKEDEFKFYLEDANSKLLLLPEEGNAAASAAAGQLSVPAKRVQLQMRSGQPAMVFTPPSPGNSRAGTDLQPQPGDVALFLHTSGTTSRPKGVPLTHANLAASILNIIATYELVPSDRSYVVMPLFHVHGLMAGLLAPLAAGASVILPEGGKFSAQAFWPDCCAHGATFYTAVPTMHQVLLSRADKDYPASSPPPLRFIRSCSSSLAPSTLHELEKRFKVPVLEAYAMTEASHQMTSNPLPKNGPHKAGTVGTAQGSLKVVILGADLQVLPVGQVGEVCIRGPNVTAGYLNNPAANKEGFAGGWFHTGDQGKLDEAGYLTLVGRIKELINRGGEKISPLEVDAVLLSHPAVAEAVCFGAPDTKYGEVVAAVVVLRPGAPKDEKALVADIRRHCSAKLSAFKVPGQIFFTETLPKTATGKIQRRHMVEAFLGPNKSAGGGGGESKAEADAPGAAKPAAPKPSAGPTPGLQDGAALAARALKELGVKYIFGVVGIPVTALASAAQAAGIRFIGMHNEQSAGYAAAAAGYLSGNPAVLLTVSGPGAIHGIAGLSHAKVNSWPLIMVSGSCETAEIGKGAFQEADQVEAVAQWVKYAGRARQPASIADVCAAAHRAALNGRPGAAYVDLPSNVLTGDAKDVTLQLPPVPAVRARPAANTLHISHAAELLRSAARPLIVAGKGAAQAGAEQPLQRLAEGWNLPVLLTSMARGVLPDDHALTVNAARSAALKGADVVLVVGARLNWQLHFGEAPKWAPGVRFILLDIDPSPRDADIAKVVLVGDAFIVLDQLALHLRSPPGLDPANFAPWVQGLQRHVQASSASLQRRLAGPPKSPLDYYSTLAVIKKHIQAQSPAPIVVSEGANTMDMSRLILPVSEPRTRLDAGTWGTMGVGPGYAIGAAVSRPDRLVVAVEGDSAFGFSGMEVETMNRYKLPIVVIVMNNGGVYGGDRREGSLITAAHDGAKKAGFASDPAPTAFVPGCRYDQMMTALGGDGYHVTTAQELDAALAKAFAARRPALLNVVLDSMAGVESGNVHAFNAPVKARL